MDEETKIIATEALNLQIELNALTDVLDNKKEELRKLADDKVMHIVVPGLGKIDITVPRVGKLKVELDLNEEKLKQVPALRQLLLDKGIAKEVLVVDIDKLITAQELKQKLIHKGVVQERISKVSAARASVRIQPNK
jgi:hypothetical protein